MVVEFESITETDVDDAIVALKTRGRLLGDTPSTLTTYVNQSLYPSSKFAS